MHRGTRKSTVLVAAAAMLAALGALPAMSSAQTNSLPDGGIACGDFARGANGQWTVLRPATISPHGTVLNLMPGQTFTPSEMVGGIEITAVLDRNCGNP